VYFINVLCSHCCAAVSLVMWIANYLGKILKIDMHGWAYILFFPHARTWRTHKNGEIMNVYDMTWCEVHSEIQYTVRNIELTSNIPTFTFSAVSVYLLEQYHHCVLHSVSQIFKVHCSSESELKRNSSMLVVLILRESFAMMLVAKLLVFRNTGPKSIVYKIPVSLQI
jgi:hypothetical protein